MNKLILADWLAYIETLNPKTMDLGLDRVSKVAEKLQLNQFTIPVITIAGTNGKGSCVSFLEAILLEAGYKVGAYTSPHLLSFNERIQINHSPVSDQNLCEAFSIIEQAREEIALTYFEYTTLAALWIFKQEKLDVLLLEVGLGGRLDAVNVVDSDIAIISSIALDHKDYLGDNRESIGYEKAGIFRQNKPAVCGDPHPPQSILLAAQQRDVDLYCAGRDFTYQVDANHWEWEEKNPSPLVGEEPAPHLMRGGTKYRMRGNISLKSLPIPHLPLQNAATALMALHLLNNSAKLCVPAKHIKQGLIKARLPGRFQCIKRRSIMSILDVAHNPASVQLLAQRLKQQPCEGRTWAVMSMLADKDIKGSLIPLQDLVDSWFVAPLNAARACSSEQIFQYLQDIGVKKCYNKASVKEAYNAALELANEGDRIVIYGSFYTVAAVLESLV